VFLLIVGLLFGLSAIGQPAFLKDGLVAYYPFNGNANDESGNGFNAQVYNTNNTALVEDRFGVGMAAVELGSQDNDDDSIVWGRGINLYESSITISCWIKGNFIPPSAGFGGIGVGGVPPNVPNPGGSLGKNLHAVVNYAYAGIIRFAFFYDDFDVPVTVVKNNEWVQIVFGFDKTKMTRYIAINGAVVAVKHSEFGFSGNDIFSFIGRRGVRMDDIRFYNRSLTDGEVKELYNYESQPKSVYPSTATATAQVVNGFVVGATITSGGNGYTNNPVVTITGGGGLGAKATAVQVNGVVTSITITNPGSGYTSAPIITIAPPPFPPKKATATSQLVNGFVVGTKITDAGFGYDAPPSVLLVGGGGTGATAVATVQNGVVTGITITNPGSGYTSAPLVRIASPPFTPKLAIEVSKVNVRLSVVLGRKYQIESSSDLANWKPASAVFIAQDEELIQEFDVNTAGSYYRINQVP
jgi:hypothetical protein